MPFLLLVLLIFAAPVSWGRSSTQEPLLEALGCIRPERVAADVRFLASSDLEGRGPQSRGLRVAARYLVSRAVSRGWPSPLGGHLHVVDVLSAGLDLGGTSARIAAGNGTPTPELVFGSDYSFLSGGYRTVHVDAELFEPDVRAFADRAQQAPAHWSGRALFVEDPTPLFDPHGLFADPEGLDWLARAGVAALVLGPAAGEELRARRAVSVAAREQLVLAPEPVLVTRLTADGLARVEAVRRAADGQVRWQEQRRLRDPREARLENVAVWFPGRGALAEEAILVCAHYDHLGRRAGVLYPGADDNASGVAALLALGEALEVLARLESGPRRSVVLAWLDGEEDGQRGAWAWTREPQLPSRTRLAGVINLDMVGRNAPDYLLYTPSPAHPRHGPLARLAAELGSQAGFDRLAGDDSQWGRSDHRPFAEVLGVPVVSFSSGEHEDYHGPGDTAERVDADKVARVAGLVLRLLVALDAESAEALGAATAVPVEALGPR